MIRMILEPLACLILAVLIMRTGTQEAGWGAITLYICGVVMALLAPLRAFTHYRAVRQARGASD